MRKLILLVSLISFLYVQGSAQKESNKHTFRIGITPSALFNGWLGYQSKITYSYNRFEFAMNTGFLKGSSNGEPYDGYRIRPTLKFYFTEIESGTFYFGFGGLYRNLNINATGTFSRFNNAFFQEIDFKIEQSMQGLYGMFGILVPLRFNGFFFDVGFGFGNSKINTTHLNVPEDATFLYTPPLFTSDSRSAGIIRYPIVFGHFAILYEF